MKKTETKINPERMAEMIKRFKINIPNLCKEIGMAESTFKNKLSPNNSLYNFTGPEYGQILRALSDQCIVQLEFCKKEMKRIDKNIQPSK